MGEGWGAVSSGRWGWRLQEWERALSLWLSSAPHSRRVLNPFQAGERLERFVVQVGVRQERGGEAVRATHPSGVELCCRDTRGCSDCPATRRPPQADRGAPNIHLPRTGTLPPMASAIVVDRLRRGAPEGRGGSRGRGRGRPPTRAAAAAARAEPNHGPACLVALIATNQGYLAKLLARAVDRGAADVELHIRNLVSINDGFAARPLMAQCRLARVGLLALPSRSPGPWCPRAARWSCSRCIGP